jgi:hypothetical protein
MSLMGPILLQKSAASLFQAGVIFLEAWLPADPTVAAGNGGTAVGAANATLTLLTQRTRPPDPGDETSVWRCGAGSGQWLRA